MKRILFLSLLLLGGSWMVSAQNIAVKSFKTLTND